MADTAQPTASPTQEPAVIGTVVEISDEKLILAVPGFDYKLHLVPAGPINAKVGDRVTGVVRASARRVDIVPAGGRYVEPVFGRPRRVQGRIVGGSVAENTIFVEAGPKVVARLMSDQKAADFATGQLASFDVEPGATFTQTD